jgi:hypothetical protein
LIGRRLSRPSGILKHVWAACNRSGKLAPRQSLIEARRNASSTSFAVRQADVRLPPVSTRIQCPAECYTPSTRPYRGPPELDYPSHDRTVTVTRCGRICFNRQKINLSVVFAGQSVGIKQVSDAIWLVSFMDYDLGYFERQTCRLKPTDNPFGPKVLPMSPE